MAEKPFNEPTRWKYELIRRDGYIKGSDNEYHTILDSFGMVSPHFYINDEVKLNMGAPSELSLTIPLKVQDTRGGHMGELIKNRYWDAFREHYIIEVTNTTYKNFKMRFILTKPTTSSAEGKDTRSVNAYSLEHEFSFKMLRNFSSKTLDENTMDIDKPWYLREILEHICSKYMDNTWSVGYIDGNVAVKMRTFDFAEGTILKFMNDDLQESFSCVFKYDTVNRTINAYDMTVYPVCPNCHTGDSLFYHDGYLECINDECYVQITDDNSDILKPTHTIQVDVPTGKLDTNGEEETEKITVIAEPVTDDDGNQVKDGSGNLLLRKANWKAKLYGEDKGLQLSDQNALIKTYEETLDADDMATRLWVYGKDELGINIATKNYAGQPYIDNFAHYRNKNYMSPNLLTALDRYDELYEANKHKWAEYNDTHYKLLRAYSEAVVISSEGKNLLEEMELALTAIKAMTSLQANGYSTATLEDLKNEIDAAFDSVQHYLDDDADIKAKEESITNILSALNSKLTGVGENIVDLSEAIEELSKDIESKLTAIKTAAADINEKSDTTIDLLQGYSLEQLQEALSIYEQRVEVLVDISNSIVSPDLNSELTTGFIWQKGDKLSYRIVTTDEDEGTATATEIKEIKLANAVNNIFEYTIPASEYSPKQRAAENVALQVWISKNTGTNKKGEPVYADRILQTENVHYYIVPIYSSKSDRTVTGYKIRQNAIDLVPIKEALEKAIAVKQAYVDSIVQKQNDNNKDIQDLKKTLNRAEATYTDSEGNTHNIFTPETIMELNHYIKDQNYTNDSIGVADIIDDTGSELYQKRVDDLYQDGLTVLDTKHTPKRDFNIQIFNFERDMRWQHFWGRTEIGNMALIMHRLADDDYMMRIIGITSSNVNNTTVDLALSNEELLRTSVRSWKELTKMATTTSTTMSINKEKWNNAEVNAVETMIVNGWNAAVSAVTAGDETDVIIDKRGITLRNPLKPEVQIRETHNIITFTDDNWNTTRTAISNGHVIADVIMGRLLVGQNLQIVATKEDGTTLTFRVNGEGVFIDNGSLYIQPMDGDTAEKNGITLSPDKNEGFICTSYDESGKAAYEIRINGQTGITIHTLDSNGNQKKKMFSASVDGETFTNGTIYAKDLCLGALNEESVVTYIEKATGLKKYGTKYDPNNVEKNLENGQTYDDVYAALSGEHLSCSGLLIDGTSRGGGSFEVTPDGNVIMKNSSITLTHNDRIKGNHMITIDPEHGIQFGTQTDSLGGYSISVDLDITTGNATFSGTVKGSNIVGSQIIGGTYFAVPEGYDENSLAWDNTGMLWDIPGPQRLVINRDGLYSLIGENVGYYAMRHGLCLMASDDFNGFGTLEFDFYGDYRGELSHGGGMLTLAPGNNTTLNLGAAGHTTFAYGTWDFSRANVVGLPEPEVTTPPVIIS